MQKRGVSISEIFWHKHIIRLTNVLLLLFSIYSTFINLGSDTSSSTLCDSSDTLYHNNYLTSVLESNIQVLGLLDKLLWMFMNMIKKTFTT